MNLALWIVQVLLAAGFGYSAWCKSHWSRERLVAAGQTGVKDVPVPLIRFIALSEALGAIGLVLPWATGIAPWLTPAAAAGLGAIMLPAMVIHARLREPQNVAANIAILTACVFVVVGRT
jgi:hypothetical protein